jgi:hypothetical protein
MLRTILLGLVTGAILGAAVGAMPRPTLGVGVWAALLAAIGAFQGWSGSWILAQSSDVPKMKAALPLSGAVLASLICIVTGEGFLEPVVACLAMGTLLGRVAERDSA